MPLLLVSLDGYADIPLDRPVVVGRDRRCDVRIGSFRVSRRHCRLAIVRDGVQIRDLGSTNGTQINGSPVDEGVLHPGDELSVAGCRFQLKSLSRS